MSEKPASPTNVPRKQDDPAPAAAPDGPPPDGGKQEAVSYTHLTLPTIYSV